jgi:signal transduction histidine kinase
VFWKYVVTLVILVTGTLLISGAIEIYFSYHENKAALIAIQREKAIGAASKIQAFVKEIESQIDWTTQPPLATSGAALQRRYDLLRLLRQVPAITEASYLDAKGKEQVRVSRLSMEVVGGQADFSADPKFRGAKADRVYYGPVYFRNESEPYMTIAIAGMGQGAGVTAVEVNLKFIWDVVSRIKVGKAGGAYAVDGSGHLLAHPDISLVLQKTAFTGLPQVQAAIAGAAPGDDHAIARDFKNRRVLSSHATIPALRWSVFVEQPLEEAFATLGDSLKRTALLELFGVVLAFLASLVLARRMVRPIAALQAGAAKIGEGDLGERIVVRTGDELEALANQFNSMAGQLKESYASLERKVEERTRELRETLEQQTATSEVLGVISSSPTDVQPVFETIVRSSKRLLEARSAVVLRLVDGELRLAAFTATGERADDELRRFYPRPLDGASAQAVAARDRVPFVVSDVETDARLAPASRSVARARGYRSMLIVPMLRKDETIGTISVSRATAGSFSDKDITLLQTFADQAVIAIENVRLFTEIEEKSRELEVANRHKSEFLANMSHELRTPLNAIIGFSEVLLARMFGEVNEKQDEYLQDIFTSGTHLLSLINDILDLSKVEAGRMELELTTFSLPTAIDSALTLVRTRAETHGITLETDVDGRLGDFVGDERKIKQILVNLLSNAVKFTGDGGKVAVHASPANGHVEISVTDTGVGIPREEQDLIFEEFRQAGPDHAGKREGTGLGLTLTRKFIELHGGSIRVKSELGRGSTFTFTLPVRPWPTS